jgi:hypothetical protein
VCVPCRPQLLPQQPGLPAEQLVQVLSCLAQLRGVVGHHHSTPLLVSVLQHLPARLPQLSGRCVFGSAWHAWCVRDVRHVRRVLLSEVWF